jgi:sugar phosphate isomerase/epimerase
VETSFLASCREARRFIGAVNHPACRLHLDMKAMAHEPAGTVATILEHRWEVVHFHGNDVNHRGPGQGPTDLQAVARTLSEINYRGWVSVEPFDYHPTPEECARISLENLKASFSEKS